MKEQVGWLYVPVITLICLKELRTANAEEIHFVSTRRRRRTDGRSGRAQRDATRAKEQIDATPNEGRTATQD